MEQLTSTPTYSGASAPPGYATLNKDFHIVAQHGSQTPPVDVNDIVAEKCD